MKLLLCAGGLLLLCGCASSLPNEMTWRDYYLSRHALRVTYQRAEVLGCEDLGAVSGKSHDDVGSAKEGAISAAVLLGADHLLFEDIMADMNERSAYLHGAGSVIYVYGTAYRCGR
jgi:hypothetical protein